MLGLTAAALLSACGAVGYYGQAVRGGAGVLLARRSIDKVLADPATPEALAAQLRLVQELRRFAADGLALPTDGAFRHYSDLKRPFAVWNVVAAPELSLEPKLWCFPVAGCVSYRGYFREEAAHRYAERLAAEGWDVAVQGATAYSTLGWFDDPVLSTFVHYPEPYLAGLLFHELAHAKVYLPGDTTFNESFATAVEEEGVARWLEARERAGDLEGYREAQRNEELFTGLVLEYRERLRAAYAEDVDAAQRLRAKERLLGELKAAYQKLREEWTAGEWYDRWFDQPLNNAHLASIGAYHQWTPAFAALLRGESAGDLAVFYQKVEAFAALPTEERRERLEELAARR